MASVSVPAKIMYANYEGIYVIQLLGDVRLSICTTFDAFLEKMFLDSSLSGALIDLNQAQGLDSTTLGLIAKVALRMEQKSLPAPMILSTDSGINRLLDNMGFRKIFYIITANMDELTSGNDMKEMPDEPMNYLCLEKVLEAHRILMSLNDKNHDTFKSVVATLEAEQQSSQLPVRVDRLR